MYSCQFSLSGRDGDSNWFLPSWGIIPNTHPYFPRQVTFGTTQVQSRVGPAPHPQRYNQSAKGARDSIPPLGLRHWLSAHPYCLQGAHFNCWCPRPELSYSASRSERLIRSTMWEACVQHDKMTSNGWSLNDTDGITMIPQHKTPPGLHLFNNTRLCSTIAQYSQPWSSYHL